MGQNHTKNLNIRIYSGTMSCAAGNSLSLHQKGNKGYGIEIVTQYKSTTMAIFPTAFDFLLGIDYKQKNNVYIVFCNYDGIACNMGITFSAINNELYNMKQIPCINIILRTLRTSKKEVERIYNVKRHIFVLWSLYQMDLISNIVGLIINQYIPEIDINMLLLVRYKSSINLVIYEQSNSINDYDYPEVRPIVDNILRMIKVK